MTSLKNKVALVTGSARGIGKAIAVRYGSLGASVVVNYSTDGKRAQETVEEIERVGSIAIAVQADISKVADIDRLFAAALDKFGRLDIVVANAGIELVGQSVLDLMEADFDRLFGINTKGSFFTLQKAAKHVADNGRIIYIGSSSTAFPMPGLALYGGSKVAPRVFFEAPAQEGFEVQLLCEQRECKKTAQTPPEENLGQVAASHNWRSPLRALKSRTSDQVVFRAPRSRCRQ